MIGQSLFGASARNVQAPSVTISQDNKNRPRRAHVLALVIGQFQELSPMSSVAIPVETVRGVQVAARTTISYAGAAIEVVADEPTMRKLQKRSAGAETEQLKLMAASLMDRYKAFGLDIKPYKRIILSQKRPDRSRDLLTVDAKALKEGLDQASASWSPDRSLKAQGRELARIAPEETTEWACAEDPDCACCWCEFYKWIE
jgi:hypothetical protein